MVMVYRTKKAGEKMEIPVNIARSIVKILERNIGHKINFMDSKGQIIASSDTSRIGQIHEGALVVTRTRKAFTITSDMNYSFTREGINLPVEIDNRIIGTVGITGKAEEVEVFGTIIKSMTEILITNYLDSNARQYELERERLIVNHLLYQTKTDFRSDERNAIQAVKDQTNHVIVWVNNQEVESVIERTELYAHFKRMLNDHNHFISVLNYEIILIVDADITEARLRAIHEFKLLKNFKIGIGQPIEHSSHLEKSYSVAKFIANETNDVFSYQYLEDEYILKTIHETAAELFIRRVLQHLSDGEIENFISLLEVYEKHNGSIKGMAEELYIHKNTVQYRLDKMFVETGYNPRELADFYKLKLAFKIWAHRNGRI